MRSGNSLSILSRAAKGDLRLTPFPHLVIENALAPELFAELSATFPADDVVVNGREVKDTWFDYPACEVIKDPRITPLWQEFFRFHTSADFYLDLLRVAGDALKALNPELENRVGKRLEDFAVGMRPGGRGDPLAPGADVSMECQFYVNYSRQPRTVRGPHVDRPSELFAALLYFRQSDDDSQGADLDICEATSKIYPNDHAIRIDEWPAEVSGDRVRTVSTAKYRANTLVLFLNSAKSLHGVSPRTPTPLTRRHINFCADVRFDLFDIKLPPRLALKKTLEATPVLWRIGKQL